MNLFGMNPITQALLDSANESVHIIIRLLPLAEGQLNRVDFGELRRQIKRLEADAEKLERETK